MLSILDSVPSTNETSKWTDLAICLSSDLVESLKLSLTDIPSVPYATFVKIERSLNFLDIFKSICVKAGQTLTDIIEANRSYRKYCMKIFDKHGQWRRLLLLFFVLLFVFLLLSLFFIVVNNAVVIFILRFLLFFFSNHFLLCLLYSFLLFYISLSIIFLLYTSLNSFFLSYFY